jgi:hypothetical protein
VLRSLRRRNGQCKGRLGRDRPGAEIREVSATRTVALEFPPRTGAFGYSLLGIAMKHLWFALLFTSALLVTGGVGFWAGIREGESLYDLFAVPIHGTVATRALTDLKEGKTRGASLLLELQVDNGLLAVNELDESPIRRFIGDLPGIQGPWHTADDVVRLANYRKANPSPFEAKSEFLEHDPQETSEQRKRVDERIEQHRKAVRDIQRVVEQYASK